MTPEETDKHAKAAQAVRNEQPVDARLVRSARPGGRILLVLGGGLLLVIIAFAVIWGTGGGALKKTNANDGDQAVDAAAFQDRVDVPKADAPTTATGDAALRPTGSAPNVNAPTVPSN